MRGLSFEPRSLHHEQDGAEVIEFLGAMVLVVGTILLVVQITLVFMNAILVNHALGLAAQETAVRGGVDDNVENLFRRHLPRGVRSQAAPLTVSPASFRQGQITPGNEPSQSADVMTLAFAYEQELGLMKLVGVDSGMTIRRSMKVASQSAKED